MLRHLKVVMEEMAKRPDQRVVDLPLANEEEYQEYSQVLRQWNEP